ncbi:MAG: DUF503 domain-containing protein [Clostridia bacterium]|nr:DUF503 domain-containing protein [Clostridia bacterium]
MFVCICTIKLHVYSSHSLKDKRSVIKSIIQRVKCKFNVSIAEIDYLDILTKSEIGIACVGNSATRCSAAMDRVIDFVENDLRIEIIDINKEIL